MTPILDYHMHTPLCGHATGQPSEYAAYAIKVGLKEIGFSDHAPLVTHRDPGVSMDFDELPLYHKMIEDVREEFKDQLIIKVGIEVDFASGFEKQSQAIIDAYPYDYVYGSVHYINSWAFDNPQEKNGWDNQKTDDVYRDYYDHLRRSAESGLFDIMGHIDLVKKFGHKPTTNMFDEVQKTAEVFKASGVTIEINTSGLRKPCREIYPSLSLLKIYCAAGVPLTFGSDAHNPYDVGADYDQGRELALAAGYKEYRRFKQRQVEEVLPL